MADTLFVNGTPIIPTWLNDINNTVYRGNSGIFGSVPRTAVSKMSDVVSVKDFGAVGDGVTDDSMAWQNAINATTGILQAEKNKVYNISIVLLLNSNIYINLNGSTIKWVGAILNNGNKSTKWDCAVFRINAQIPSPTKNNIKIYNGSILVNDWGCGISAKQVDGFEFSDLYIEKAQAEGIVVSDSTVGTITRCRLLDCAANPTSGFTPNTDLEGFSDGIFIFYGSQNITVSDCVVTNTRVGTGRLGIGADGPFSTESGRYTTNITFKNCRAVGYDRAGHTELSRSVSFEQCDLEFVDSGSKTYNCAIAIWNTEDTVVVGCRVRSTKSVLLSSGSVNANVLGGSWKKTGANTDVWMKNTDQTHTDIRFYGVDIDLGLGNGNFFRCSLEFRDCRITSPSFVAHLVYGGSTSVKAFNCLFDKAGLTQSGGDAATDKIETTDCTYTGFSSTNYPVAFIGTQGYFRKPRFEAGNVRIYVGDRLVFDDMDIGRLPAFDGPAGALVSINGDWLGNAIPIVGTWVQGQRFRNTAAGAGSVIGWQCITGGTPGVWKSMGTLAP